MAQNSSSHTLEKLEQPKVEKSLSAKDKEEGKAEDDLEEEEYYDEEYDDQEESKIGESQGQVKMDISDSASFMNDEIAKIK